MHDTFHKYIVWQATLENLSLAIICSKSLIWFYSIATYRIVSLTRHLYHFWFYCCPIVIDRIIFIESFTSDKSYVWVCYCVYRILYHIITTHFNYIYICGYTIHVIELNCVHILVDFGIKYNNNIVFYFIFLGFFTYDMQFGYKTHKTTVIKPKRVWSKRDLSLVWQCLSSKIAVATTLC